MSNQKPLTKTQKIEKVRHLLVLFENLRNAEKDFRSSCQIIAKQLDIHQSLLRKAVELEHKNALGIGNFRCTVSVLVRFTLVALGLAIGNKTSHHRASVFIISRL